MTVAKDGASLVVATWSASVVQAYDPLPNQISRTSTSLRDQRMNSLTDHRWLSVSGLLDFPSEWAKQAQAQVKEKIATNKTLENITVRKP
jgi:hypothetical protein